LARSALVDSAGLYALADHRDSAHPDAAACVARLLEARAALFLTDYLIDEAVTLAKVRAGPRAALRCWKSWNGRAAFSPVWIGAERFESARKFFRKHADHGYSFTDCTSFVVMQELGIVHALTTDRHFVEAGFKTLLPVV